MATPAERFHAGDVGDGRELEIPRPVSSPRHPPVLTALDPDRSG
ncbi:MAG: hypothetical protein QOH91_4569, partial [Mycobacterium sp.]|nr:hypothetical protein [Mycobacterium sp.]